MLSTVWSPSIECDAKAKTSSESMLRTMSGNDPWRTIDRDEYMPPGYNVARQGILPIRIPISTEQKYRCPSSVDESDDRSDASSQTTSTAPSSVPSTDSVPIAAMNPIDYGYEFCCPFEFVGCELSFHPTQIDAYISHTITHFFDHRPPPKTICIFCPQIFENPNDRVANWRERMRHIADHYRRLERFEHSGPDFFVIEYMRQKRIISGDDYKWATRHTERHDCDGLVDFGHKTAEMRRKEGKSIEEPYDLEKEDRHRRRYMSSKSKGKEGKRHTRN